MFAITIIPVAAGMYVQGRSPGWVAEREPAIKKVTLIVFVIVVIGAVVSEIETITEHFADLAFATLALNVAAMTVSAAVARVAGLDGRQTTSIALEVHNSTLAIAVATTIATILATPAAVYSVFMFITAGAFARVMWMRNGYAAGS